MTEAYVRPDVKMFLAFANAAPGPRMTELSPPDARLAMLALRSVADAPVGTLAVIKNLEIPGPAGMIPARLYDARENREPGPVMMFFHGGGWVIGDLDTHEPYCTEAARLLDLPIVAIDYRLAPEHVWPAAHEDCEAAARWIASNPAQFGRTATSLILSGDSAGGNLAITTAMDLRAQPAAIPVIAQFPIYPATDMSKDYASAADFAEGRLLTKESMEWFGSHYAADANHVRHSPLLGDLTGMPPALVLTAGLDPLRDQGRAYAAALALAGVPVTYREAVGNIHGFINLAKAIPSSAGDIAGALATLKAIIVEAEANRVMAQAAG